MNITLKTSVNTRLPLSSRLPRTSTSQAEKHPSFCSIHQTKASTYDIDYTTAQVGVRSEQKTEMNNCPGTRSSQDAKDSDGIILGTGEDPIASQLPYKVVSDPSSGWESEAHAATRSIEPGRQTDFYSIARRIERKKDDARVYGPNITQRAEQIRLSRSQDPSLRRSDPAYLRVAPSDAHKENSPQHRVKNYLDLVECAHLNPRTEQQIDFDAPPRARLPGLDFPQSFHPQSKIITHMGTTSNLFQGTPKCLEHKIVGYAGHVSSADQNLAAMRNDQDPCAAFAKAYMTLAVSGGGVDASVNGRNPFAFRRRGRYAREPVALRPKSNETICRMVEGSMLQQTIHRTLESERTINSREDKKQTSYF